MERVTLQVPSMYADHHVTAIKRTLGELAGVSGIEASAAFKLLEVSFDPDLVTSSAIREHLVEMGHRFEEEVPPQGPVDEGDPAWRATGPRDTSTDPVEVEMSGEFRLY